MLWLYSIPTVWAFVVFVTVIPIIAMFGLYLFKWSNLSSLKCKNNNGLVGIFVGIVSVFLGVMLSFLVVTVWTNYSSAQLNDQREAGAIYILYQMIATMPGTEIIQALIIEYLEFIINVEFPALNEGEVTDEGLNLIKALQRALYDYTPVDQRQTVLYSKCVKLLNTLLTLRVDRLHDATTGVYDVVWWVSILDAVLLVAMTWFLNCDGVFHYLLVAIAAVYVAASMFIIVILAYPYLGYQGLNASPYQFALDNILNPTKPNMLNLEEAEKIINDIDI